MGILGHAYPPACAVVRTHSCICLPLVVVVARESSDATSCTKLQTCPLSVCRLSIEIESCIYEGLFFAYVSLKFYGSYKPFYSAYDSFMMDYLNLMTFFVLLLSVWIKLNASASSVIFKYFFEKNIFYPRHP